ncbi:putative peptidyl-tRNA hydrolase PTRHD1 [Symsagittifera roscoffensis]|uniref:putative peptidyl-tRNA hydrolase PTRHD1 n=1 Tax=Symsagittifera roscoffensis TaxID=84072 RepID=UPI00307C88D4
MSEIESANGDGGGGNLVQYIVIRGDLKWPKGALVAQACHASSAIIHLTYSHPDTQQYLSDLDNMHKVVLKSKTSDELSQLSDTLTSKDIAHKLWIEQPENYPTCLAIRPIGKPEVSEFVKQFQLFR